MSNFLKRGVSLGAIAVLPATVLFSLAPASANPYAGCVSQMINGGVSGDQAATACAQALIPLELSACVGQITSGAKIPADKALQGCFQVRRPVDLGNCVVDINNSLSLATIPPSKTPQESTSTSAEASESPTLVALDSCRQSLLPGPYSQCVIAVAQNVPATTPVQAMNTCLSAQDFPRDLFPAYAPE